MTNEEAAKLIREKVPEATSVCIVWTDNRTPPWDVEVTIGENSFLVSSADEKFGHGDTLEDAVQSVLDAALTN